MLKDKRDIGLLIVRVGLGLMFIFHGFPKLAAGPGRWEKLGQSMSLIGINFWKPFWGFLAGFTECVGGLLLMFGMFHTIVCLLLVFTMTIAALKNYYAGEGFKGFAHPVEVGIVFLALLFTGPGKFSIGAKLFLGKK